MKPRVLVLSSTEGIDFAYAVQENLENDAEVTVWAQGVFQLSQSALGSLARAFSRVDVGVFVLAPDDLITVRGVRFPAVRDNVLFELGLFVGAVGHERACLLIPKGRRLPRLPHYLVDLTHATFDAKRDDTNLQAALGPACNKIRKLIKRVGVRRNHASRCA